MKVPISQVFDTDKAVKPVLEFLADTDMRRVTGVQEGDKVVTEEGGSSSEDELEGDGKRGRGGWKDVRLF